MKAAPKRKSFATACGETALGRGRDLARPPGHLPALPGEAPNRQQRRRHADRLPASALGAGRIPGRTPVPGGGGPGQGDRQRAAPLQSSDRHGGALSDLVGELGQYRILKKLAEGGMGTVYKALHTKLGREVALKVLPAGDWGSTPAIARFEREIKAIGQLDHPHIVRALDAGEVEGIRFLVLEYVDGADLSRLVHRRGPLPVAQACELVRQAAVGLQYAHEHLLIHRDVKPSNLMADPRGQVKILDLGLAQLRPAEPSGDEMTRVRQIVGTPEYMSPEQAADAPSVNVRADVYSLGCTLHYLLVGRAPYTGETTHQILTAHQQNPIPSLRDERDDVPEKLDRVFQKMLAKTG